MKRPLNRIENLQLKISKSHYEKVLAKNIRWKELVFLFGLETIFIYLIIKNDNDWFLILFAVIVPFAIWMISNEYIRGQKESKEMLRIINKIEKDKELDVSKFESNKAILFQSFDDEGILLVQQIEKHKSIGLWKYEYDTDFNLPNNKFEVYFNDEVTKIFNTDINAYGEYFQPIKINGSVKSEVWDHLPKHKEIINYNIEEFLNFIEEKTRPNKVQNVHSR